MALKIRLRRMGRKKAPTYRIVIAESSMPRDGRFVASIGHYNPRSNPVTLVVDRDKALSWLDQGATPTETVHALLRKAGVFGPAPTVTEQAVETVKATAKKAAGAARAAVAAAVDAVQDAAEEVVETVQEAVEEVRERAAGQDEGEGEEKA